MKLEIIFAASRPISWFDTGNHIMKSFLTSNYQSKYVGKMWKIFHECEVFYLSNISNIFPVIIFIGVCLVGWRYCQDSAQDFICQSLTQIGLQLHNPLARLSNLHTNHDQSPGKLMNREEWLWDPFTLSHVWFVALNFGCT